jgi:hypothetical protein
MGQHKRGSEDEIDPARSSRDEFYPKGRKGGVVVRIQADYSRGGRLLRYSLALIDTHRTGADGGPILGYDNAHGHHHRHYDSRLPLHYPAILQLSDATSHCSRVSISSGPVKWQIQGTEAERWSRESLARSSYRQPFNAGDSWFEGGRAAHLPPPLSAERPLSGGTARLLALDECLVEQFDLVVSVLPVKLPQQPLLQRHMIMLPKYTQRARRRHNEQLRDLAGQHFVVEPCSN